MLNTAFILLNALVIFQIVIADTKNAETTVKVFEGQKIDLVCDISPKDEVVVILWQKDSKILYRENVQQKRQTQNNLKDSRVYFDLSQDLSVLQLESLKVEDEGEYKCRVRFKDGPLRETFFRVEIIDSSNATLNLDESGSNSTYTDGDINKEKELIESETGSPKLEKSTSPDFIIDERISTTSSSVFLRSEDYEEKDAPGDGSSTNLCGPPPVIEGASTQLKGEQHSIGTVSSYRCEFGYVTQGPGKFQAVCQQNSLNKAYWTNPKVACVPRSCGDPGYVSFSQRAGNLFTFPNKVEFKCDEGYKLRGAGVRYCQASGEWSGRLPTCEQIYCLAPPNPPNGQVRYNSLEYGSVLRYECNKGFILKKHQSRYCSENETWSNDEPVCIEAACHVPEAPEYGSVQVSNQPKVGSIALYSCDRGKTLIGASTSKCLVTSQWTFPPPICSNPCIVPMISNGELGKYEMETRRFLPDKQVFVRFKVGDHVDQGTQVILKCKDGFKPESLIPLDPNNLVQAVACENGEWNTSLACKTTSCHGKAPAIEHGRPVVNYNFHGHVIYYSCDNYYVKGNSGHVKCEYGEWQGHTPTCVDGRCYLKDLHVEGLWKPNKKFTEHSKKFAVSCVSGFRVSRKSLEIACWEGQWEIPLTPCTAGSVTSATPQLIHTTEGTIRPFSGFATPKPSDIRSEECYCIYKSYNTNLLAFLDNKRLFYDSKIRKGSEVQISCRYDALTWSNGLRLRGTANLACDVCEEWLPSVHLPDCRIVSGDDPFIVLNSNLKLLPRGIVEAKEKETVYVQCENVYRGYPIWSPATLNEVELFYLPDGGDGVSKSVLRIAEIKNIHTGQYECYTRRNYDLLKLRSTFLDLRVTGSTCPIFILHGGVEVSYTNGNQVCSVAMFKCQPYYELVGEATSRCQNDGTWSNSFPYCKTAELRCPQIDEERTFNIWYGNNRKVNSFAKFSCKKRSQKLVGEIEWMCSDSGEWIGEKPECIDIVCSKFPVTPGLEIMYTSEQYAGSIATFECSPPSTLEGSTFATCTINGTWSSQQPRCISPGCSLEDLMSFVPLNVVPNMIDVTSEIVPDGFELMLLCEKNLTLVGNAKAKCNFVRWDLGNAKCEARCQLNTDVSSQLIVNPIKEHYRLGETVLFTCPKDYKLTTEVERVMCIGSSWSDPIPQCGPSKDKMK